MADDSSYRFASYKDFLHSINKDAHFYRTASYDERLGLTYLKAKAILTGYGLRWFDEGWNPSVYTYQVSQEYLFDLAEAKWNKWESTNPNKFTGDDVQRQVVILSFFPLARKTLKYSGMIHLLFDPNELFASNGPLFDKLQEFKDKGLVKGESGEYLWVYPGDLLLETPIQTELPAYSYYDIAIFNELLNGDLTFMGWHEKKRKMLPVSIYAQLGLPLGFDLEVHISEYLNEFPDYNQP